MNWLLYGATGYTGVLVAEEAVKRGHQPVLAGRNPDKLIPLAKRLGLEWIAFTLDDVNTIAEAIADFDIVYHCAGPFIHTSDPMIRACLATGTHYLDITGEIDVFENTFTYDETARKVGIVLMGGVGFDVIPTDCISKYVTDQVPGATQLEVGFMALSGVSAGTTKSMLEMMPRGGRVRRNGHLQSIGFGSQTRRVKFGKKSYNAMAIPWGDVSTAYRTTGVPNITAYMVMPSSLITLSRLTSGIGRAMLSVAPIRSGLSAIVDRVVSGPSEMSRETNRAYIWARAVDDAGNQAEAWLTTAEAYQFTAVCAIDVIERVAQQNLIGAITPAMAFGSDFVLAIEGSEGFFDV